MPLSVGLLILAARLAAKAHISDLIENGAVPAEIASFVDGVCHVAPVVGIHLSWEIENVAFEGTFAGAVFEILAS
jgi:hypothetical protein